MSRAGYSHSITLQNTVHDILASNHEWGTCILEYQRKMEEGYFPFWYIDSIIQKDSAYWRYDLYDAYCFAVVHAAIKAGNILTAQIDIGQSPLADSRKAGNNRILKTLWHPFWARFWGELRDSDGILGWNSSIIFGQRLLDGQIYEKKIGADSLPLEIGVTLGSRTLLHIYAEGGVARWPYNSPKIYLFKLTKRHHLPMKIKEAPLKVTHDKNSYKI